MRQTACMLITAALTGLIPFAGCSDAANDDGGVRDNAIAQIGEAVITKAEFERTLRLTTRGADGPPDAAVRSGVIESLIRDEWFRQEAAARDLAVTDAELQGALEDAESSGFLSDEALKRSDMTVEEIRPILRRGELQREVTELLTARGDSVSARDVSGYYRRNKKQLIVDERRDVRLVVAKRRAKADAARAALDGGRSWDAIARQYSDLDSRERGGRIADLRRGDKKGGVVASIFRAKQGVLTGPVDDAGSWAVFVVERIKPSFQATLEQSRDEIKKLLSMRWRERAITAFNEKYKEKTTCAPAYNVGLCKNGPKPAERGS